MSYGREVSWDIDAAWEPHDCDVCGYSYEHVTVEYNGTDFTVRGNWGCYSGLTEYNLDLELAIALLEDELPEGFISEADRNAVVEEMRRET